MRRTQETGYWVPGLMLCLIIPLMTFGRPKDNHKEVIEKARQLLLQKERVPEITLLVEELKKGARQNSSGVKQLTAALAEISSTFIFDKTQQSYELGLSLLEAEPAQALAKFEDGVRLEPNNFTIELAAVRT